MEKAHSVLKRISTKLFPLEKKNTVLIFETRRCAKSSNGNEAPLKYIMKTIKEIDRLRKEINRLLSKGMSNIYLKVAIETFSKLRFSWLEKFVTNSVLGSSNSCRYH